MSFIYYVGRMSVTPPRMTNLINAFGKFAAVGGDRSTNDALLVQWDCVPNQKAQLWSWNEVSLGSTDRHLCNGH